MREQAQVPEAEFESYYGRQIIKTPTWKQPDVPLYLFLGGAAGASALLAEGAAATGRPALATASKAVAAGGAGLSTVALIHDLGRPSRFLNMLRVFRPTSPMSMGSWILAPFAGLSTASAMSHATGIFPRLGRMAGMGAAALGPAMASYTGALIAGNAVPAWHEAYRELPFVFIGSGAAAAGGIAMTAVPTDQAGPARKMMIGGAAVELVSFELLRRRLGELAEPYEQNRPGTLLKAARVCTVAGAAASVIGGRSRTVSVLGGLAAATGSLLTRFGVFQAGIASAKDPKYTVRPQRERLNAGPSINARDDVAI